MKHFWLALSLLLLLFASAQAAMRWSILWQGKQDFGVHVAPGDGGTAVIATDALLIEGTSDKLLIEGTSDALLIE